MDREKNCFSSLGKFMLFLILSVPFKPIYHKIHILVSKTFSKRSPKITLWLFCIFSEFNFQISLWPSALLEFSLALFFWAEDSYISVYTPIYESSSYKEAKIIWYLIANFGTPAFQNLWNWIGVFEYFCAKFYFAFRLIFVKQLLSFSCTVFLWIFQRRSQISCTDSVFCPSWTKVFFFKFFSSYKKNCVLEITALQMHCIRQLLNNFTKQIRALNSFLFWNLFKINCFAATRFCH